MDGLAVYRRPLLILLVLLFAATRFWRIADSCLWFDEIFSVHAAEQGLSNLFQFLALDLIHPPLFYLLLKAWIAIGGEGTFWLRTLPALISIAALVPLFGLGKELKLNFRSTAILLFLVTVNGSLLKYSQEVRMYSLLLFLSLLSYWLFVRYLRGKTLLLALAACNLALVHTHYFGWLVLASQVVAVLALDRKRSVKYLASVVAVAVLFIPWILAVLSASAGGSSIRQNIGWMPRPGLREAAGFAMGLFEPFHYQASSAEPLSEWKVTIPLFLMIGTSLILAAIRKRTGSGEKHAHILLAVFLLVPIVVAFASSWLAPVSVWGNRHLIIVTVPFLFLLAKALGELSYSKFAAAATTLIILLCGYAFVNEYRAPRAEMAWCTMERAASAAAPGETILAVEDLTAYHLWFALRQKGVTVKKLAGTGAAEDSAYFLPRGFNDVETVEIEAIREPELLVAFRGPAGTPRSQPVIHALEHSRYTVESISETPGIESVYIARFLRR